MSQRKLLKIELENKFIPYLDSIGFRGPNALLGNTLCYEYRREVEDICQMLDIQFEKYGKPRFVINFWEKDRNGPKKFQIPARLKPLPGGTTKSWFRTDRSLCERLFRNKSRSESEVVSELLLFFKEVEEWFNKKHVGPHISIIGLKKEAI